MKEIVEDPMKASKMTIDDKQGHETIVIENAVIKICKLLNLGNNSIDLFIALLIIIISS